MTLSVANTNFIRTGKGNLYLAAYPGTITGADLSAKITTLFALFYASGTNRTTLAGAVEPWATLSADGFSLKLKQDSITYDPNSAAPFTVGLKDMEAKVEFSFGELHANKLAEALSTAATSILTTASGTGVAGRTTIAMGAESSPTFYTALYRCESKNFVGQYDNILIPKLSFSPDFDIQLKKGEAVKLKVSGLANAETQLTAANGLPIQVVLDTVTAAAG